MKIQCGNCGGSGYVKHVKFGLPSCPMPEVLCDNCGGEGVEDIEESELISLGWTEKELAKLKK